MMEPDASIESGCMIRIAVLPVGIIPPPELRDYISMLLRHGKVELSAISSFYTEHQKSPFAHQLWDSGSLRLKFMVGGAPPSPWEDYQSNRKILAVIGLCHCPSSPDLDVITDQFAASCRSYTSALVTRCFAFSPSDSQLIDGGKKGNLMLFPPADRSTQEFHLHTMVQDIAASLLMEFEKWVLRAESTGTILKTPLDSQTSLSTEEVIKAKKRRLGRAQKTIGDYCLLAGSPVDANAHYSTAVELARLTGDVFWHAGALEGAACALLINHAGDIDTILEEEVKYRYYTVIQLYRRSFIQDNAQRVSTVSFELEAALKLARFLCQKEMAKEVVELLMGAADGAKSLIDANDRLVLFVEIARLFGALGYERKAAFFSRMVAQLYLQQENCAAAICAMQVLAITAKTYHVQSRGTRKSIRSSSEELGASHTHGDKIHPQLVVQLFESQWSTIQMVVLREVLFSSVCAGDHLAAWSAAARLLRSYYPLITPAGQSGLADVLIKSAKKLSSGIRCADPSLPFVRLHSFPGCPSQVDIIKRDPNKAEWWTGSAPSGPFIYTPFSKGDLKTRSKKDLIWIVGETIQVLVELANPCGFDIVIDGIYLSVDTGNIDAFPASVCLPSNSAKVISLSGIPTSVGPVRISGCTVHCFDVITEHHFSDVENLLLGAAQGLVLSDPFRSCGSSNFKHVPVPNILVVPPLPLLVSHVVGMEGAAILYEGEIRDVWVSLANAGSVPVEQADVSLSGKNHDSVISVARESLKSALPLKPGAEILLPVTVRAWQLNLGDSDIVCRSGSGNGGKLTKEGSICLLIICYAGPLELHTGHYICNSGVTYGRRLVVPLEVCVLPGVSLLKAQLLSVNIPADTIKFSTASHGGEDFPESTSDEINPGSNERTDPCSRSWDLCLLELELFNPTATTFVIDVSIQLDGTGCSTSYISYPETRIDGDHSSRVLIPLEHFKLPALDGSSFPGEHLVDDCSDDQSLNVTKKSTRTTLDAVIKNIVSKIKVRWKSGRNSFGELNVKDAIQAALQASAIDVLLPYPLTSRFKLAGVVNVTAQTESNKQLPCIIKSFPGFKCSLLTHEMVPFDALIQNNTREKIRMTFSISCKDVAGENCVDGDECPVMWSGVLSGIYIEVPPLQEIIHSFSLCFLVPGDYTLVGAAVIEHHNDVLRDRARTCIGGDEVFFQGCPFQVSVTGNT